MLPEDSTRDLHLPETSTPRTPPIRRYESIDESRNDEVLKKADESTRVAAGWVREQQLETAIPNGSTVTAGDVVVRETCELVNA
jgi:hypothetical protein